MKFEITDTDIPELLNKWYKRLRESQFSHYQAEGYYARLHYFLGIPAIAISAIVGTSIFSTIGSSSTSQEIQITVGLISLLATVLISLQTFLKFSEQAEKHRITAAKYGALRRSIEQIKTFMSSEIEFENLESEITALRNRIDELAEDAPNVPKKVWKQAKQVMDEETKR